MCRMRVFNIVVVVLFEANICTGIFSYYSWCVECLIVGIGSGTCTYDPIKIRIRLIYVTWKVNRFVLAYTQIFCIIVTIFTI